MARATLPFYSAIAGFTSVFLACVLAREIRGPRPVPPRLAEPAGIAAQVAEAVLPSQPAPLARQDSAARQDVAGPAAAEERYYSGLRGSVRWVQARLGHGSYVTPDPDSRLLLAKSAAQRAGLAEVGLGWRDVYGVIDAETSWVPRTGRSRDGTPNLGIAQFEPATARALGVRDPHDLVEAVHVAARHMKEAALWSADRIAGLKLGADERAAKLREGVSVYYNLSSRGRAAWNGRNTRELPRETQLHIRNARVGAQQAGLLDARMRPADPGGRTGAAVLTAGTAPRRM